MPVIHRIGSVSIRIYADDHRPPHFHIASPEFEVIVRLSDLTVIAGRAPQRALAPAMAWARQNRQLLAAKWNELNERG